MVWLVCQRCMNMWSLSDDSRTILLSRIRAAVDYTGYEVPINHQHDPSMEVTLSNTLLDIESKFLNHLTRIH